MVRICDRFLNSGYTRPSIEGRPSVPAKIPLDKSFVGLSTIHEHEALESAKLGVSSALPSHATEAKAFVKEIASSSSSCASYIREAVFDKLSTTASVSSRSLSPVADVDCDSCRGTAKGKAPVEVGQDSNSG